MYPVYSSASTPSHHAAPIPATKLLLLAAAVCAAAIAAVIMPGLRTGIGAVCLIGATTAYVFWNRIKEYLPSCDWFGWLNICSNAANTALTNVAPHNNALQRASIGRGSSPSLRLPEGLRAAVGRRSREDPIPSGRASQVDYPSSTRHGRAPVGHPLPSSDSIGWESENARPEHAPVGHS